MRAIIEEYEEEESCFSSGEIEGEMRVILNQKELLVGRGRGAGGKTKVLGMKKRGDKVYTQIV